MKTTPAQAGCATSAAPISPSPGKNCSAARGTPASMSSFDRLEGDERRLFGGLGDDAIAGDQRGGDLADENRQRKIPRRDADEDAAPDPPQGYFPRRSVPARPSRGKSRAPAARNSGKDRPPRGFPPARRRASCRLRLAAARSTIRAAPRSDRRRARSRWRASRRLSRSSRESLSRAASIAASTAPASASATSPIFAPSIGETQARGFIVVACDGIAAMLALARGVDLAAQGGKRGAVAKFDAGGIGAQRRIKFGGRDDARVARLFGRADQRVRVGDQRRLRRQGIGRARDERRIGAVLDQAAHEIGEQIAVRPDRRIDAPGDAQTVQRRRRQALRPCRAGAETRSSRAPRPP